MKILIGSHHFLPSTGGIEIVTNLLAREFTQRGHEVRVVTQTTGGITIDFAVIRQPRPAELLAQLRWCDVFLQNNISLRTGWATLLVHKPLFVVQQTWIAPTLTRPFKHLMLRRARCFAISSAIAQSLPVRAIRVGNPYDASVFVDEGGIRDRELIFVGRLVSDKGVDILLDALSQLREHTIAPRLTIVGDGPERSTLVRQTADLHLDAQVEFVGAKASGEIAALLNRHRILVVPSRLPEPFGIVAVEGIACGCAVVGSNEGGLPEAIGPCGLTFPNGNAAALAELLADLLRHREKAETFRARAGAHLAQFTTANVADVYLEAMAASLR